MAIERVARSKRLALPRQLNRAWYMVRALSQFKILIAMVLLAPSVSLSEERPSEASKIRQIQAVIETENMEMPVHWQSRYPDELLKYCSMFLEDLKAGPAIQVIEPVLSTDDPNHTGLARYGGACRATRNANANYHRLSDIGTHAFRLYRIEVDGDTRNGPEEILYAEGNPRRTGGGAYYRVDLERCTAKVLGHPCCKTTLPPGDSRASIANVNALIEYRGVLAVLEMVGEKRKDRMEFQYGIDLWGLDARNQCRYAPQ